MPSTSARSGILRIFSIRERVAAYNMLSFRKMIDPKEKAARGARAQHAPLLLLFLFKKIGAMERRRRSIAPIFLKRSWRQNRQLCLFCSCELFLKAYFKNSGCLI